MTHASLFSGIGGPEVAATMLGWDNLFHCEINPFGRKILDYWYPNSKSYEDITKTDFSEWRGKVDVLTGGFPCQPFSYAGKRRGADDDRYLWPYMFKAIDQIRPTWIVAENVAGITTMVEQGEVSEMGGQASMFEEVDGLHRYQLRETFTLQRICDDLEGHGYSVQPVLVPACSVGAPHRRDRVFIVARRSSSETDNTRDRTSDRESGRVRKEVDGKRENITLYGTCRQSVGNAAADIDNDGSCRGKGETRERRQDCGDGKRNKKIDEDRLGLRRELRTAGVRTTASNTDSRRVQGFHSDGELCEERNNKKPFANTCGDAFSDTSCSGADKYMESELADGAKPVGNSGQRNVADTCHAGLQEARPEQPATRTAGAFPQPAPDTSCSGTGTPGESGCTERERRRDDVEPEKRGEQTEWSYGFYELLRNPSDSESEQSGRCELGQPRCRKPKQGQSGGRDCEDDAERHAGDTYGQRREEQYVPSERIEKVRFDCKTNNDEHIAGLGRWDSFPTVSPVHRGNDGIPFDVDDLAIPFSKWRTESLKAYGNAIVPQVMYEIFRAIELVEKQTKN